VDPAAHLTEFADRHMRRSKALVCLFSAAVLSLLFSQMAANARSIVLIYLVVVGAGIATLLVGMVRSLRMGIFVVPDGVVVRTPFLTRSWKWGELDRVSSIDMTSRGGPVGIAGMTTQRSAPLTVIVPVFRPVGKTPVPIRALKVATKSPQDGNGLDDVLQVINRFIGEHRAAGGASAVPPTPS
jgi:hypothetical protein